MHCCFCLFPGKVEEKKTTFLTHLLCLLVSHIILDLESKILIPFPIC